MPLTLTNGTGAEPGTATRVARHAVAVSFAVAGVVLASWLGRVPALRDAFGLTTTQLGLLLLCLSAGAVVALPSAGPLLARVGARRTVAAGVVAVSAGLLVAAVGVLSGVVVLAGAGLFVTGTGTGVWDVGMNVEASVVERRVARSIMSRFHAWFSIGTVAGAGLAAGLAWLQVPLGRQLLVTAVATAVVMGLLAIPRYLPTAAPAAPEPGAARFGIAQAWREPRTLVLGLMTLGFAFTEGVANDWFAVALVDGYGAGEAVGAVGFGVFVAAMTIGRLTGGALLDRFGRVPVLRASAVLAILGVAVVVLGANLAWAMAGALLWGLGAALGFPTGMSAGADDPARAAARVSVVSSIAYTAFLAGPPLLGPLADTVGMPLALGVVGVAAALAFAASGSARPVGVAGHRGEWPRMGG